MAKVTHPLDEQFPGKAEKTAACLKELGPLHGSHNITKIFLCPAI